MNHRVLIVDDSLTVRMDLVEGFEAGGLRTVVCATGTEARTALALEQFALVVLDVVLPDADGLDLLREIRESKAGATPIMLLSSEAEVRDRIRGLSTGADEYVGKPYERNYVVARAWELLRRGRAGGTAIRTVLVIDDSATFRDALGRALQTEGYQVAVASSGEEGLRIAADIRPAATIVDGVLPGMDGRMVIRRLRLDAALRLTPCLLLTGSEETSAELEALEAGADAFVKKEEDIAVILARLAALLRGSRGDSGDAGAASSLGPKKILVVDDSNTYLQALASALRVEDYDVVLAHSGEEALDLLQVQPVACILLNRLMPGLSGHETCQRIKAQTSLRDVPLIMLTALEDRAAMVEAFAAGADDCISKAADFDILRARVRAQIRRRQFESESGRVRERLLRMEMETAEARSAHQLAEMRAVLVEELKLKNRALRESEERLMGLVETIAEGVFIVGTDGQISFANAMAEKLVGLPREVITQRTHNAPAWRVTAPDGEPFPDEVFPVAIVLRTGKPIYGVDAAIERPDGSRVMIRVNASPIRGTDGELTGVIATVSDVTHQKEVELMKDTLVSTVSHELRTPLSSLMGFTELMLKREYPAEKRQEYLTIIHSESVRLASIIDDFLDLQRMESGQETYQIGDFNLVVLLERTGALFEVGKHRLVLELPAAPVIVRADPDRIRQVLSNLVSNATKFSPPGSTVTIGTRIEGNEAVVWITDQGIGIPAEVQSKLFAKFYRANDKETRRVGGTGLGLALVKEIVQAHGGRVWVESQTGVGSTFRFSLPTAEKPSSAGVESSPLPSTSTS